MRAHVTLTLLLIGGLVPTAGRADDASNALALSPDGGPAVGTTFADEKDNTASQNVGDPPVASPAPKPIQPDPAFVALDTKLENLAAGILPEDIPLDSLFTVRLDDPKALVSRLVSLQTELTQLLGAREHLERSLARPDEILIPPQAPDVLKAEPQAPQPPLRSEIAIADTDGGIAEDGGEPEADAEGSEWKKRLAEHEQALERFRFEHENWQTAKNAHETAMAAHRLQLAEFTDKSAQALADTKIKEQIAARRLAALTELSKKLEALSGPAIQSLADMGKPRSAIRERSATLRKIMPAVSRLSTRIGILSDRLVGGGLLGLRVQRDEATTQLVSARDRAHLLIEQATSLADRHESLAQDLETRSRTLRRSIIKAIIAKAPPDQIDSLFALHLEESRALSKRVTATKLILLDPQTTTAALDALVPKPEQPGTAAEAGQWAEATQAGLESLDASFSGLQAGLDRWRLAFARESVTLLSALASDEARQQAFSLSGEMLSDLQADLAVAWENLKTWANSRWQTIKDLPTWATSSEGGLYLLRLALAFGLLLGLALLRRPISGLALRLVRLARRRVTLQHSIGGLVRWAGLLQAVLPTLALLLVGYVALSLLGLDRPEVAFIEVAFFWLTIYYLGRQIILGMTRRVSRGRPALLPAGDNTVYLLRVTYGRLGLFLATVAIASRWGKDWLGAGTLSQLVVWVAWFWLAIWALWAGIAWREKLGSAIADHFSDASSLHRAGRYIEQHRIGALASPLAFLLLIGIAAIKGVRKLLALGGFFSYLRSRALSRLSRKEAERLKDGPPPELPEAYVKEFPLYPILGDEEAIILPRTSIVNIALEQIGLWRPSGREGSLVLVGEKGSGKTTLLAMMTREIRDIEIIRHTIAKKRVTEKGLMRELGPVLGLGDEHVAVGPLAAKLKSGEPKIVLLDEAHNLFLRTVDGYRAFDAMVRLVTYSAERVFWVLAFNTFSWEFLNESRKRFHYFRKLVTIPPWSAEELAELVNTRNKRAGFQVDLDPVLLDTDRGSSGDVELVETTEGFFRLLRQASGGNPRVATHLWLNALKPGGENRLQLGLFRHESTDHLQSLGAELLFALAAICQHENLSVDELRQVLNVPLDFAGFAIRFLTEYGYIEPKHTDPRRVTLAPRFYQQVLSLLRKRHLLFERE